MFPYHLCHPRLSQSINETCPHNLPTLETQKSRLWFFYSFSYFKPSVKTRLQPEDANHTALGRLYFKRTSTETNAPRSQAHSYPRRTATSSPDPLDCSNYPARSRTGFSHTHFRRTHSSSSTSDARAPNPRIMFTVPSPNSAERRPPAACRSFKLVLRQQRLLHP